MNTIAIEFCCKKVLGKSETDGCLQGPPVCQVRRGEIVGASYSFSCDAPYDYFADNQRQRTNIKFDCKLKPEKVRNLPAQQGK